jgi:hypothetical protein
MYAIKLPGLMPEARFELARKKCTRPSTVPVYQVPALGLIPGGRIELPFAPYESAVFPLHHPGKIIKKVLYRRKLWTGGIF